jgi:hypothetical protein
VATRKLAAVFGADSRLQMQQACTLAEAVRLPALWLAGRRLVYEVKRVFVALRDGWRRF